MTEQQLFDLYPELALMPRAGLKEDVWQQLERMKPMVTAEYKRAGFRTVTPYALVPDLARTVEFVKNVFDGVVTQQSTGSEGGTHTEMKLAGEGAMLMLSQATPKWPAMPVVIHLFVDDVDAYYERAVAAGAKVLMGDAGKPADREWGQRTTYLQDADGNTWFLAKHLGSSELQEQPLIQYLHPKRTAPLIDFLKAAFEAEELERHHAPDGVVLHAALKIGDSRVEMSDYPEDTPQMVYVYTEDPDAVYRRAMAAGATSIWEPVKQPYGEYVGGFIDPAGNNWFVARAV